MHIIDCNLINWAENNLNKQQNIYIYSNFSMKRNKTTKNRKKLTKISKDITLN